MTLAQRIRSLVKRMRETQFSRDRAALISESIPVMEKAAEALEQRKPEAPSPGIDSDLARLLDALGEGTQFPGRENYINDTVQFDEAVKALRKRYRYEKIRL